MKKLLTLLYLKTMINDKGIIKDITEIRKIKECELQVFLNKGWEIAGITPDCNYMIKRTYTVPDYIQSILEKLRDIFLSNETEVIRRLKEKLIIVFRYLNSNNDELPTLPNIELFNSMRWLYSELQKYYDPYGSTITAIPYDLLIISVSERFRKYFD